MRQPLVEGTFRLSNQFLTEDFSTFRLSCDRCSPSYRTILPLSYRFRSLHALERQNHKTNCTPRDSAWIDRAASFMGHEL